MEGQKRNNTAAAAAAAAVKCPCLPLLYGIEIEIEFEIQNRRHSDGHLEGKKIRLSQRNMITKKNNKKEEPN